MADYYQLLGVTPQASAAEIRQAYAKLARERHPDRFPDPEAKQKAQREIQDITTAFNTLANPKSREEYDRAARQAGTAHARGDRDRRLRALEGGSGGRAARQGGGAAAYSGSPRAGQVAYQLALGRALGKAAGAQAAREAVQVLERVTQLAPNNATAFVELAKVLARQGLKKAKK